MDDSNAKLDEISKLFATYLAFKNGQIPKFPTTDSASVVSELQAAFAATAVFRNTAFTEAYPSLASRLRWHPPGDESLAADLVRLVRNCIDLAFALKADGCPFDILNEAFGHFVRDNFRGNIEDAQYMTPPEVVDFMVEMALHDIAAEEPESRNGSKHWSVLDPSCGVGSFLAAIYHHAQRSDWLAPKRLRLFGQDKVERMVRLSTINLELFDVEEHRITIGNSLERNSPIDSLNGTGGHHSNQSAVRSEVRPTDMSSPHAARIPRSFPRCVALPPRSDSELLFRRPELATVARRRATVDRCAR